MQKQKTLAKEKCSSRGLIFKSVTIRIASLLAVFFLHLRRCVSGGHQRSEGRLETKKDDEEILASSHDWRAVEAGG